MNVEKSGTSRNIDIVQLQQDVENIIIQFFSGVPHALQCHRKASPPAPILTLDDDNKYREESYSCIKRIRSTIETFREELLEQAASGILTYLTKYKVRSNSCDPLKMAYWFGLALAEKVGEHNDLDKKVVLTLTVEVLDMFCGWHNGNRLSSDLKTKLHLSIAQNKSHEDFGSYGIYFSFKALVKLNS